MWGERTDAASVGLAEPEDQQPGSGLSDGCGVLWSAHRLYINSRLCCHLQQVGSQWPLPVRAPLSVYVSHKPSGCFQFWMEQSFYSSMHVWRGHFFYTSLSTVLLLGRRHQKWHLSGSRPRNVDHTSRQMLQPRNLLKHRTTKELPRLR